MKKLLPTSAILAILLLMVMHGGASAQHRVQTIRTVHLNVSGTSEQDWSGTTYGAFTDTSVQDANTNFTNGTYQYFINADAVGGWNVEVGVTDAKGTSADLCGTGKGLNFFYTITDNGVAKASSCFAPTAKQIGNNVQFGISFYLTGGPGIFVWIDNSSDSTNECAPCSYDAGVKPTYSDMNIQVNENVAYTGNGNAIDAPLYFWRNEYVQSTGSTVLQAVNGTQTNPDPPTMYEFIVPSAANEGGVLLACANRAAYADDCG